MTTLVHVKLALLPQVIAATRNWLVQIIETRPGWITEEQAIALLLHGELQLHLAIDEKNVAVAALVTELKQSPSGKIKVCCIVGIAGINRHLWMDHLEGMEDWARAEGCSAVLIQNGRKGWLREEKLKPYRVTYSFQRELA